MRHILLAALLVTSCGDGVSFTLGSTAAEPFDRPLLEAALFIDGVATDSIEVAYASLEEAMADTHVVELRRGDVVLRSLEVAIGRQGCVDELSGITEYSESYCTYESGDLRPGTVLVRAGDESCIAGATCAPACRPDRAQDGCTGSTHCTSIVTSVEPFASHLGCAPTGSRLPGEACALTSDPQHGTYDDCVRGFLCVEGTCRRRCLDDGAPCTTCGYVPGHAPEMRVCLDP